MWVSLLLLVVMLAITLKQGARGLFDAFLTAMLAICCAAVAFGTYEWIANHWISSVWPAESLNRDFMLPLALGLTFGVPLLILRLAFDRLLRRPIPLPGWADRFGAGICGLVTGLIMISVLAVCLEMIPFGGTFLGYSRVTAALPSSTRAATEEPPDAAEQDRELLFGAPDFAPGLVSVISTGIFSGSHDFHEHNPDLLQSIGWVGATHREVSRYAPPKSIAFVRTEPVDAVYQMITADAQSSEPPTHRKIEPEAGHEFRMVRVRLNREARDIRKAHAFALRQFRLVGLTEEGTPHQLDPVALQQEDESDLVNRHIKVTKRHGKFWPATTDVYAPRSDNADEVEIVFEIPKGFKSTFLEYKREARAAFSLDQAAGAAAAPPARRSRAEAAAPTPETPDRTASAAGEEERAPGSPRRGRARTVTTEETTSRASRFSDELPMPMRSYQPRNAEISGITLAGGHLVGETGQQQTGRQPEVNKFAVPSDKRLLQLSVSRLQSRSGLGQAMSRAIEVIQNYYVEDEHGNRYTLAGKWAIATVRGRDYVEIQYFPPPSGSMGGLGAFQRIRENRLTPQDDFVLLFLVDPGVRIVSFSSGGAGQKDDLTAENLTAPP